MRSAIKRTVKLITKDTGKIEHKTLKKPGLPLVLASLTLPVPIPDEEKKLI